MKKILSVIGCFVLTAGVLTSCHKIEVDVTSELTPDVYPQTDAQFSSASGPVYINLRSEFGTTISFLQDMTTDESLLPTYAADWIDGNRYLEASSPYLDERQCPGSKRMELLVEYDWYR
jgi:hypothetical protein